MKELKTKAKQLSIEEYKLNAMKYDWLQKLKEDLIKPKVDIIKPKDDIEEEKPKIKDKKKVLLKNYIWGWFRRWNRRFKTYSTKTND